MIDDTVADCIVSLFKANIWMKPGSRYSFVRETVLAVVISYQLKQTDLRKAWRKRAMKRSSRRCRERHVG